jgi:hypothetical protein
MVKVQMACSRAASKRKSTPRDVCDDTKGGDKYLGHERSYSLLYRLRSRERCVESRLDTAKD